MISTAMVIYHIPVILTWLLTAVAETKSSTSENEGKIKYLNPKTSFFNGNRDYNQKLKRFSYFGPTDTNSYKDLEMWEVRNDHSHLKDLLQQDALQYSAHDDDESSHENDYSDMCPCYCENGSCRLLHRDVRQSTEGKSDRKLDELFDGKFGSLLIPQRETEQDSNERKYSPTQLDHVDNVKTRITDKGKPVDCADVEKQTAEKVISLLVPMFLEEVRKHLCKNQKKTASPKNNAGESIKWRAPDDEDSMDLTKFRSRFYASEEKAEERVEKDLIDSVIQIIDKLALQYSVTKQKELDKNSTFAQETLLRQKKPTKELPVTQSVTLKALPDHDSLLFSGSIKGQSAADSSARVHASEKQKKGITSFLKRFSIKSAPSLRTLHHSNSLKSIRREVRNHTRFTDTQQKNKDHGKQKFADKQNGVKELNSDNSKPREEMGELDRFWLKTLGSEKLPSSDIKLQKHRSEKNTEKTKMSKKTLPSDKKQRQSKLKNGSFRGNWTSSSSSTSTQAKEMDNKVPYVLPSINCVHVTQSTCWLEKRLGDSVLLAAKLKTPTSDLQYEALWERRTKVYKSEELVEVLYEDIPGYLSFSPDRMKLRIHHLIDNDMYYNSYRLYMRYVQKSDPEIGNIYKDLGSITFKINIVPFDAGVLTPGKKIVIDITNYLASNIQQSYLVGWLVETFYDKGKPIPNNMKESNDGSVLTVENDPIAKGWIVDGIVYDTDGTFVARRRFSILTSSVVNDYNLSKVTPGIFEYPELTGFSQRR